MLLLLIATPTVSRKRVDLSHSANSVFLFLILEAYISPKFILQQILCEKKMICGVCLNEMTLNEPSTGKKRLKKKRQMSDEYHHLVVWFLVLDASVRGGEEKTSNSSRNSGQKSITNTPPDAVKLYWSSRGFRRRSLSERTAERASPNAPEQSERSAVTNNSALETAFHLLRGTKTKFLPATSATLWWEDRHSLDVE